VTEFPNLISRQDVAPSYSDLSAFLMTFHK